MLTRLCHSEGVERPKNLNKKLADFDFIDISKNSANFAAQPAAYFSQPPFCLDIKMV